MANEIIVEITARLDKIEKQLGDFQSNTEKSFGNLGEKIGNSLGGEVFSKGLELFKQFGPAVAVLAASFEILKKQVDLAFEGEKINSINAQFEVLTKNVGLAGSELKEKLVGAAQGLIDETEVIQAANKGLIELGNNADKLPQILEIATKATQVFGGTAVQNFEAIDQAVASGNTRAIRNLGIVINQEEAVRKFADANNVSVSSLTEAGRRQAILNEVLAVGERSFQGIDPNVRQMGAGLDRLKVAISDLNSELAILANERLSGVVAGFENFTASVVKGFTQAVKFANDDSLEGRMRRLNDELQKTDAFVKELSGNQTLSNSSMFQYGEALKGAQGRAEELRGKLALLEEEQRKINSQAAVKAAGAEPEPVDPNKLFNLQAVEAARLQLIAKLEQTNADIVDLQTKGADQQTAALLTNTAKIQAVEAATDAQVAELRKQRRDADLESKRVIDDLIVASEEKKNAQILEFRRQSDIVGLNLSKGFQQALGQGIAGGINNLVTSLVKGQNAFQNFGKFILNLIGDFAIQIGSTIIATGIAYKSLGDFTGTAPILFGGALVALGAILKALAGAGNTEIGGGAGGGGLAGGFTPAGSEPVTQGFLQQRSNLTGVTVNVSGNVLDRRQTGLELAEVIQEHFNNNGQVLATGGI